MPIAHVKFAVVREDPEAELKLIEQFHPKNLLMIASGGCTALSIKCVHPHLNVTLLDPNKAQLEHVQSKISALKATSGNDFNKTFNIGSFNPSGLNQCGSFERLFHVLRTMLYNFVAPKEEWLAFFAQPSDEFIQNITKNKFWPLTFKLAFDNEFLSAIFGPEATQNAEPDSYARYFQGVFERGLAHTDADKNYFLHHILLGFYIDKDDCLPLYLQGQYLNCIYDFTFLESTFQDLPSIAPYDFINLSNILDWMDPEQSRALLQKINQDATPGTVVLWRQLNNEFDYMSYMSSFNFHIQLQIETMQNDRSLFYNRLCIGSKRDP